MKATTSLEVIVEHGPDGSVRLLAPAVGILTCAASRGQVLAPGSQAGVLEILDAGHPLLVPEGVEGRVISNRPQRVHEPVGFRALLFELAPFADAPLADVSAASPSAGQNGLFLPAPYSGRFWRCPAPGEAPFVDEGDLVREGSVVGMIEVMKTFAHLHYEPGHGLPATARILRAVVEEGGEVATAAPLFEVEPA